MDGDHPHQPTEHEAPHAHEGPGAPLVDHHVLATIRLLLDGPATERSVRRPASAELVLDRIEHHFNQLDWLIGLSRRTVLGDRPARELLSSWLESQILQNLPGPDPSPPSTNPGRVEAPVPNHHGDDGPTTEAPPGESAEQGRGPTLGLNVRAIRELFLGAVYAMGPDTVERTGIIGLLHVGLGRSLRILGMLYQNAVRALSGLEHPETVPNLLLQLPPWPDLEDFLFGHPLPEKSPKLPPLLDPDPILECLGALREGTIGAGSAFAEWRDATSDTEGLTGLVVGVSPASVCAGSDVLLHADASNPKKQFPPIRPVGYEVFLEPCGIPARIKEWVADHVTIEVPAGASSGCVTFGRFPSSETPGAMQQAEGNAVESFFACLGNFGLGRPGMGPIMLNPQTLCRLVECRPGSPNFIQVRHEPEIISFVARDPAGRAIGTDGIEAGTQVTVSWDVRSDDTGPLQIAMSGARTLAGLPAKGSLVLSPQDTRTQQTLTLQATNSCGTGTRTVTVPVFRKLYLSPTPLSIMVNGAGALTIRSSCPVTSDVTVTLNGSNPDGSVPPRVTVPPTATIPAGQDRVTVAVAPSLVGSMTAYVGSLRQSQAATIVNATAPSHDPEAVGVWVEPPLGQSNIVSPTNADGPVVAVHMAVVHTGRVLMFSADDTDFRNIDKVKTRLWDPATNTLLTPSFPYPTHKNLFCAGHCLLPDGRVLVVGGHAIFAGGSAAKAVHTFSPITNSWSRYSFMQKDRWYPTCVTLPDGRALITSGSEAGGPPTILKGVVRDVEVFDPATGGLTAFHNIHGDICMYPYMFVLPGGLLFFHSRNVSWLFAPGPGAWSPTNGSWSGDILMQGSTTTRTYPGMAGCVLLPLLPEDGYAVRVLMAGGGGAKESELNGSTIATQTAEILDVDVSQNSGRWRNTSRGGNPLLMTTPRFMSDAVLLPDGNVLLVNGAAVGKADDAHVSVAFAELFDTQTESFRPLTSMSVPRLYHGTALLLPDGRVAVAGHTKDFNKPPVELNRFEVELISPPYLFRGPRPLINNVSFTGATLGYGQDVTISTDRPADIARVSLVRPGSVTHQLNTDQRYVGLVITQRSSGSVTVKAPPDAPTAPPGHYLLFLVDGRGVPSRGEFVRVG